MPSTFKEGKILLQFGSTQGWESFGEVCRGQKTQEGILESAEGLGQLFLNTACVLQLSQAICFSLRWR